jgi:hypothetical protein
MPHSPPRLEDLGLTRRGLLRRGGTGRGLLGLAAVLAEDRLIAQPLAGANG